MPVQVFRLRNVPEDEVEEVRELLEKNNFDFYETPAGNWGISMPAIWLNEDEQLEEAKALLEQYQIERQARVRKEREQSKSMGERTSFINELLSNPIQFIFYIAIAAVVLYFSIKPFLDLGK